MWPERLRSRPASSSPVGQTLWLRRDSAATTTLHGLERSPRGQPPIALLSLGVWTWRPSNCYDGASDPCVQNSPRTDIRAGSQVGLAAARVGSYTTLSVAATYYSPTASVYRMWAHEKVQLQYRACPTCTWTYLRNVYTASNGRTTYRTYAAHTRYYRAVSAAVPSIWGRTSAVILR